MCVLLLLARKQASLLILKDATMREAKSMNQKLENKSTRFT